MRKLLLMLVLLTSFCNAVYAQQQEWVNKKYDFSSVKRIYIDYKVNDKLKNGITEKETEEIYQEKFENNLVKKLPPKIYEVKTRMDIPNFSSDMLEQKEKYLKDNFDIVIEISLENYTVGTQYADGYTYSVPVTNYSSVYTDKGPVTVATTTQQTHYVSGGNFPTVFVNVRFDIYDTKNGEAVWSRIDDRSRRNEDEFDNTKPKDVFGRIMKDFNNALQKKLKSTKIDE